MDSGRSVSCRTQQLVIEALPDGEVLVYDLRTDQAHQLDADAARVWQHAGDPEALGDLTHEQIRVTLDRLEGLDLLESVSSRRSVLRKAAVVAAIGVPVIRTITAPTAAQASTGLADGQPCSSPLECQSGLCSAGVCGS